MDPKLWGTILLILGIALIIVQVVFSWRAAQRVKEEEEKAKKGLESNFGAFLSDILKELAKTLPFAVAGILLILIGAAIGGLFNPAEWFPVSTPSGHVIDSVRGVDRVAVTPQR